MSETTSTVFEGFNKFLTYSHDDYSGTRAVFRFPNGYGATVTRDRISKEQVNGDWEVNLLDRNCPFFSKPTEKNEQLWLKKFFSFEYENDETFIKWSLCEEEVNVLLYEIMQMKETFADKIMKFFNNLKECLWKY